MCEIAQTKPVKSTCTIFPIKMLNDDVKRGFSLGTFSFLFQLSNIGSGAEDLCIIIALGGEPGLQIQWVFCAD